MTRELVDQLSWERIIAAGLVCVASLLFGWRCIAASRNRIYYCTDSDEASRLVDAMPSLRQYYPTAWLIGGWMQTLSTDYVATPALEYRLEVRRGPEAMHVRARVRHDYY
jgi:hypothetical protein